MTYQNQENSLHAGQPIELYRFALGTTIWRYTSARDAVTYNAEKYIPAPIRRSEIEQTQEFGRAMLNLEAALDIGVVQSFIVTPPDGVLSLTIFRQHLTDPNAEFITWWKGRVVSVVFSGVTVQMRCEPIFTTLKRSGRRANYQINCRHPLYHGGCKVNAADYKT
ncbi:baseplate hub domain-containing protein, partial [Ralstonia mannitolilytica]